MRLEWYLYKSAFLLLRVDITFVRIYHSLAKERPWTEHLTSLPKRGVGALSSVSTFKHKRVPMSCLQHPRPTKQIIGRTLAYHGITSFFEVES